MCVRAHEPSLSALQQCLLSSACGAVDCVTLQGNLDALQSTLGNVHTSDELQLTEETKGGSQQGRKNKYHEKKKLGFFNLKIYET